jgi:hypothetical protein
VSDFAIALLVPRSSNVLRPAVPVGARVATTGSMTLGREILMRTSTLTTTEYEVRTQRPNPEDN